MQCASRTSAIAETTRKRPWHFAQYEERARHDGARERALNELGWCVVHLAEHQVFGDLEAVVALITECARCLATWAP